MKFLLVGLLALFSLQTFATDVKDYIQLEAGVYKTTDESGKYCIFTVAQSADKAKLFVGIGGEYCSNRGTYVYKANSYIEGNDNFYKSANFGIGLISKNSLYLGDARSNVIVFVKDNNQQCKETKDK